jgi:hypothetical protein
MPTWVLVSWADDTARVEIDIDANNRVTTVRRVGERFATVVISLANGSRSHTIPRNFTEFTIGTGVAQRLQLTFDAVRNRWSGLGGYVVDE